MTGKKVGKLQNFSNIFSLNCFSSILSMFVQSISWLCEERLKSITKATKMATPNDLVEKQETMQYGTDSKDARNSETDVERESGSVEDFSSFVVDKKLERRLLWKFDIYILPMLAIMYLFKYVPPQSQDQD